MTGPPALTIIAHGNPVPQGSKRIGRHGHRPVIIDDNDRELSPWRDTVTSAAVDARRAAGLTAFDCAVAVDMTFWLPAPSSLPKSWLDRPSRWPRTKPDLDKLVRAVLDSLEGGGVVTNDSRVQRLTAVKRYVGDGSDTPGVRVRLWALAGVQWPDIGGTQ